MDNKMFVVTITNLYTKGAKQPSIKYQITKKKITIGRNIKNDIVLRQSNISSKHTSIKLTRKGIVISDLNSANGTLINGLRIDKPTLVSASDEIILGGSRIELSGHPSLGHSPNANINDHKIVNNQLPVKNKSESSPDNKSSIPAKEISYSKPASSSSDPFAYSAAIANKASSSPLSLLLSKDDAKKIFDNFPPELTDNLPDNFPSSKEIAGASSTKQSEPSSFSSSVSPSSPAATAFPIPEPESKAFPSQVHAEQFPLEYSDHKLNVSASNKAVMANINNGIINIEIEKIGSSPASSKDIRKFAEPLITIGRAPGNILSLYCNRTSSYHAVIELKQHGLYITDKNSSNGTFVNNNKINSPTLLQAGDQVCIGSFFLYINIDTQSSSLPPSILNNNSNIPSSPELEPTFRQPVPFPVTAQPGSQIPPSVQQSQNQPGLEPFPLPSQSASRAGAPPTLQPASGIQNNQLIIPSISTDDISLSNNFYSFIISLETSKLTVAKILDNTQDLGVKTDIKLKQKCSILAQILRTLFDFKFDISNLKDAQGLVDNVTANLVDAIKLFASDSKTICFVNDLSRALALLYPYSTDNSTHPSGPIGIPGLFFMKNANESYQKVPEINFLSGPNDAATDGALMARFMVSADLNYYNTISAISQSMSDAFYYSADLAKSIECILDEACANVIEHAFEIPYSGFFLISILTNGNTNELIITIDDKGLPFDINKANTGQLDGMGLTIIRRLCKKAEFIDLKQDGKRLKITLDLPPKFTGVFASNKLKLNNFALITSSTQFSIEILTPDQAEEIPRCLYRAYKLDYYEEKFYQFENLKKNLNLQTQQSVMAFSKERVGVGHLCITTESKESPSAQLEGRFIVYPLRTGNMISKLILSVIELAKKKGIRGLWYNAPVNQPYELVAMRGIGAISTGLFLEYFPDKFIRSNESQKHAALSYYIKLGALPVQTVFLPPSYAAILKTLYQAIGIERQLSQFPAGKNIQLSAISNISTILSESQGIAYIKIVEYGDDCIQNVVMQLKSMLDHNISSIYIDLPLMAPTTVAMCTYFEESGFFFAGLIPDTQNGDVLRLQYIKDFKINNNIVLNEKLDQHILTFILQDAQRVTKNKL